MGAGTREPTPGTGPGNRSGRPAISGALVIAQRAPLHDEIRLRIAARDTTPETSAMTAATSRMRSRPFVEPVTEEDF
jgi:hypothetical protein